MAAAARPPPPPHPRRGRRANPPARPRAWAALARAALLLAPPLLLAPRAAAAPAERERGPPVSAELKRRRRAAMTAPPEAAGLNAAPRSAGWALLRDARPSALPRPSAAELHAAATLRRRILVGEFFRKRDPWQRPPGFVETYAHLNASCTACFEGAYRASLVAAPLAPALGVPTPLLDDAPLAAWRCAGRALERPRKRALRGLTCPGACRFPEDSKWTARRRFGMYGSVLRRGATGADAEAGGSTFRLWLGERQSWYAESEDGVGWAPPTPLRRLPGARVGEAFDNVCVTRDLRPGAPRRLLLGYSCGNKGGGESLCVAASADALEGLRWAPAGRRRWGAEAKITATVHTQPCAELAACCGPHCAYAADAQNCVRWDATAAAYRLSKRAPLSLPRADALWARHHGWRAVRAVLTLQAGSLDRAPRGWAPVREPWYFDRLGKAELLQRQPYSLSVAPAPASWGTHALGARGNGSGAAGVGGGLQLGLLSVLHWPKHLAGARQHAPIPHAYDWVGAYLLPSRDGSAFGLEWVYAHERGLLVPRGGCAPNASSRAECAPDHAYVQPASELLDVVASTRDGRALPGSAAPDPNAPPPGTRAEHWLYYEGRPTPHERRFHAPATLLLARWARHRIAGLARDAGGACNASACAALRTKPFALPAGARGLALNVDTRDERPADAADTAGAEARGGGGSVRAVLFELPHAGAAAGAEDGPPAAARRWASRPLTRVDSAAATVRWARAPRGAKDLSDVRSAAVQLELTLCGRARLYAFALTR